jgi:hypothetical protein
MEISREGAEEPDSLYSSPAQSPAEGYAMPQAFIVPTRSMAIENAPEQQSIAEEAPTPIAPEQPKQTAEAPAAEVSEGRMRQYSIESKTGSIDPLDHQFVTDVMYWNRKKFPDEITLGAEEKQLIQEYGRTYRCSLQRHGH